MDSVDTNNGELKITTSIDRNTGHYDVEDPDAGTVDIVANPGSVTYTIVDSGKLTITPLTVATKDTVVQA